MSPKYTDLVLSGSPNLRKDTNNIHVESGTGAEARNGLPGWGLYRSVTPCKSQIWSPIGLAMHWLFIGALCSERGPSILRLDVNVESYLDLHPIGVFYPDVALGRCHPSGLSRGADVAAMVQIDFNDQPVAIQHFKCNVLHWYGPRRD